MRHLRPVVYAPLAVASNVLRPPISLGCLAMRQDSLAQLLDISAAAPSQDASEAIDYAIDQLVEAAGTVTNEAERRAEDDAVNGDFYRQIDDWNMRRGAAQ